MSSAASPGASTLEVMPTPRIPACFSSSRHVSGVHGLGAQVFALLQGVDDLRPAHGAQQVRALFAAQEPLMRPIIPFDQPRAHTVDRPGNTGKRFAAAHKEEDCRFAGLIVALSHGHGFNCWNGEELRCVQVANRAGLLNGFGRGLRLRDRGNCLQCRQGAADHLVGRRRLRSSA